MEFQIIPISEAPAGVREIFWSMNRSEGSWGWYSALAETTLSPQETAVIAVVSRSGIVEAALPLVRRSPQLLRALTAPYTTRFGPAARTPAAAELLGRCLRATVSGSLRLDALDETDPSTEALLKGLETSGLSTARYRHFMNWHEKIDDFKIYWTGRDSRLQQTVRRKQRKLDRDGRLAFIYLQQQDSVISALQTYEQIYAASWKPSEPHRDFMPRMLAALAREGTVRLALLTIDSKPAAAQVWLVRNGRATIFKLAHSSEFDAHSPGTLLTHWLLSELCSRGEIQELDFGRGDDGYKRLWVHESNFRMGMIACNPRSLAGLYYTIKDIVPTRAALLLQRNRQ